jgi:FAD/FMN-containing dehydrogenase
MIPQHDVTKKEVEMVREGEIHVRLLDMEAIYEDDDEYVLIQHFEEGEKVGDVAVPKEDIPKLVDGLEWAYNREVDE